MVEKIAVILREASKVDIPQTTEWIGRDVKMLKSAFIFVLAQKGMTLVSKPLIQRGVKNERALLILSNLMGGLGAYGLSQGLAAVGIVAVPMTISPAVTLTILSVAFDILCARNSNKHENVPVRKIRITLEIPEVMKMQTLAHLEVENTKSLREIKKLLFEVFWEQFCNLSRGIKRGGTPDNIAVIDQNNCEITSDAALKKASAMTAHWCGDPYHY